MITIFVLSFQGPEGGLTFPLRGVSLHWFRKLGEGLGTVDIGAAFRRSLMLGAVVMVLHRACCRCWPGSRSARSSRGGNALFYRHGGEPDHAVDHRVARHRPAVPAARHRHQVRCSTASARAARWRTTAPRSACSPRRSGAHLTWTLPFGLLIMFAVFNRFNPAYEEAARDLGATPWQSFRHVVLPLIGPSVVGIGMFGFTLQLGRDRAHLAGHRRRQHAAARTAGADLDRDHAGDLRARHGDHRRVLRRHGGRHRARASPGCARAAPGAAGVDAAPRWHALLVINPNTSASVSELLQHHLQRAAWRALDVQTVTARFGAPYISSEASYAVAQHAVLDAWAAALRERRAARRGPDRLLRRPRPLRAARGAGVPVSGLAEAAFARRRRHGRFAIVTGGDALAADAARLACALGFADRWRRSTPSRRPAPSSPPTRGAPARLLAEACREPPAAQTP